MTEEQDRVAMLSDLRKLEERLEDRLGARMIGVEGTVKGLEGTVKGIVGIIEAKHEETRRHFDIMVEKVEAAVKIVAEVSSHHAVVVDDHETRLKKIERKR